MGNVFLRPWRCYTYAQYLWRELDTYNNGRYLELYPVFPFDQ
jgi:hypothetical protein